MKDKILLSKQMISVSTNDADISTSDKPIIGTFALATCVGVLLYSEEKKRAIVAHSSCDWQVVVKKMIDLIFENDMGNSIIKYKIIPGFHYNNYKVKEHLEGVFSSLSPMFVPFNEKEFPSDAVFVDEFTTSCQFAFNSLTGKFVSNDVLFGIDYYKACEKEENLNGKSR